MDSVSCMVVDMILDATLRVKFELWYAVCTDLERVNKWAIRSSTLSNFTLKRFPRFSVNPGKFHKVRCQLSVLVYILRDCYVIFGEHESKGKDW